MHELFILNKTFTPGEEGSGGSYRTLDRNPPPPPSSSATTEAEPRQTIRFHFTSNPNSPITPTAFYNHVTSLADDKDFEFGSARSYREFGDPVML